MSVDIKKLKHAIKNNLDLLIEVLSAYGFKSPIMKDGYIQCGFDSTSKTNTSISIKENEKGELFYLRWSNRDKGDILSLFSLKEENFGKLIKNLYDIFHGDYNKIISTFDRGETTYDLLDQLSIKPCENKYSINNIKIEKEKCLMYILLKDNISLKSQIKFRIWYDETYNRCVFTWKDIEGHIIGYMGRWNGKVEYQQKYLPIYGNFRKGNHLYGLYENLKDIISTKKCYLFEAEKSVLQMDTMNIHNCVAMGSSNPTVNQLLLLDHIGVEEIVFCFDEGLKDIIHMLERIYIICSEQGYNFKVKVMLDVRRKVLIRDSKDSPSDNGIDIWNGMHNYIYNLDDIIERIK